MLNNLQPLEIKQLNITCATMENPLSACYSDILRRAHFLYFTIFDEVKWWEKHTTIGAFCRDHRKIHLKNSFRFYWFHINVSMGSNKGYVMKRENADMFRHSHKRLHINGIFTYAAHFMYLSCGAHTNTHQPNHIHKSRRRGTRVCSNNVSEKSILAVKPNWIFEF